jgi:transposase
MPTDHQSLPLPFGPEIVGIPPPYTPPADQVGAESDPYDLPGLRFDPRKRVVKNCTIKEEAEQVKVETYPDCGCPEKDVKANGHDLQTMIDEPRGNRRVFIKLKRQRWKCKFCAATVSQPLECAVDIRCLTDPGRKTKESCKTKRLLVTHRLLKYIQIESLLRPDRKVARDVGVSVRVVTGIRGDFSPRLEKEIKFETPRVLGIDGVRVDGKMRIILTDILKGVVIDLLEEANQQIIEERLRAFPDREKIKIVVMDMCLTQRAAVQAALPHAIIVVDRWHIQKKANELMDAMRLRLFPRQKKDRDPGKKRRPRPEPFRMRRNKLKGRSAYLKVWFKEYPVLGVTYDLKEDFLEIWDDEFNEVSTTTGRSAAALKLYKEWEKTIPQGEEYAVLRKKCYKMIQTTMEEWGEYIFNYFNFPFTNAFTESANRWVKDDNRVLRGCSFKTARYRLILGCYLKKERERSIQEEDALFRPNLHKARRQNVDTATMRAHRLALANLEELEKAEPQGLVQVSLDFTN